MTTIVMDLRTQVIGLFDRIDGGLDTALGSNLPFVGSALASVLTGGVPLLDKLEQSILDELTKIDALTDPVAIANALDALDHIKASAAGDVVSVHFDLADSFTPGKTEFKLAAGIDGLGVKLDGFAQIELAYKLDLGVAFDTGTRVLTTDTALSDELKLSLTGTLDINGEGQLGVVKIIATDQLPATDPGKKTELALDLAVNIDDGLVVSDLKASDIELRINGAANVDILLETNLSTTLLPTLYMNLVAQYAIVNYDPSQGLQGLGATPTIALTNIELDLGGFVQFLASIFGPFVNQVFGSFPLGPLIDILTAPIPIIDDATRALGLIDVFDLVGEDQKVNLLDIAVVAGADQEIVNNFAKAFNLIQGIKAATATGELANIKLGSITLVGDDPTGAQNGQSSSSAFSFLDPLVNPLEAVKTGLAGHLGEAPPGKEGLGGIVTPLIDALSSVGLSIPLLSTPIKIVPLLLNGFGDQPAVTLITYDVPKLAFDARYDQFFPIIGPIGLAFGGGFNASIDVDFGYDTAGIGSEADGSSNFGKGFFFSTPELLKPIGAQLFAPAATIGVGIDAAASINIGIAEVAVGGGVGANLSAFFPNGDKPEKEGKLRLSDLLEDGCLFDPIKGTVDATVFVKFSINFVFFSWSHRFDIADITLAEFNFGCDKPSTDPEGAHQGLATLNNLTLDFNVGPNAGLRYINDMQGKDVGEHYEVRNANDPADATALIVTAFTVDELHRALVPGGPIVISADFGDARDVIVFGKTVMADSIINGGAGDDLISGGAGEDLFTGGSGNDHLIGGAGDDSLNSGNDDDLLEGGEGADFINGSNGFDQVTYEHSKAGVRFGIDPNNSAQFRGTGGEAEGDILINVEYIIGSHFDDQIYGNPSDDSTIEGLAGNDVLIGGSGNDYIIGGAGADTIDGKGGENGTSYLTSSDSVRVDLLGNVGHGGDAEGDRLYHIEYIQGSFYDDVITGNGGNNTIDGWYGDDRLAGNGGDDTITGGGGDDIIFGNDSVNSELDGGGTVYDKGQDLITYERATSGVTVDLLTNSGHDNYAYAITVEADKNGDGEKRSTTISTFENITGSNFIDALTGDNGYNIIRGLAGADELFGMGGNDTLEGGAGADKLDGGKGIDVADYHASSAAVVVSLASGQGSGGDAAGDQISLTTVENLLGSGFADTLTGDSGNNEIDPGLSRFAQSDSVDGGLGTDTLKLDYAKGDVGKGLVGGYDLNSLITGSFVRQEATTATLRDGVVFNAIERLDITGTAKADVIYGGFGNDIVNTGRGDDLIFTGLGVDRIFAGKGNDIVVSGTDASRALSLMGGSTEFELHGGAGIDTLSISLAAYTGNVVLTGTTGLSDFTEVNLVLKNGAAISEFEVLGAVFTDRGDDKITQPGNFANFIATGFGVDGISPGVGADFVDGGLDYRIGSEILEPTSTTLAPVASIAAIHANDGDLLVLDYRNSATAAVGTVVDAATGFSVLDGNIARQILSNSGHYTTATDVLDFVNIERLDVTGSAFADTLVGTNLLLGRNVGPDGAIIASGSRRGDDRLAGGEGNDLLIGNTGDDTLLGGAGDDLLVGAAIGTGLGPVIDRGEIDMLTGGTGADVFVLGTVIGSQRPIVYYGDGATSPLSGQVISDPTMSSSNRAVITDFAGAEDHLLLAGIASDYRTTESDGATHIFLRDGRDSNGNVVVANDELIADLVGVTGFRLDGASVYYVGESNFAGSAGSNAPALIDELATGNAAGNSIAARLAIPEPMALAATPAAPSTAMLTKAAPAALAGSGSWVTQTADTQELRTALFQGDSPISGGRITLEGDAAAFGTFNGDPFGLGRGIVLSTGEVEELAGRNLVDGGHKVGPAVELTFIKIGRVGNTDIFRADLTDIGFDLKSLKLVDKSGGIGGGGGNASGFDLGAVVLSHTKLDVVGMGGGPLDDPAVLPRIDAFAFDAAHVVFAPGTQRPADANFANTDDLLGAVNGLPDFTAIDFNSIAAGSLALGDGGTLGFDLTQTISTKAPLYLYVAEFGASGETLGSGFTASSDRLTTPADLSTDLGVAGVEDDSVALTYSFTVRPDATHPEGSINEVVFDFVFFSEELVEYAQSPFNDNFKITLNGVNMTQLSDGSFASVNTLYTPAANGNAASDIFKLRTDIIDSDFIYNPVGKGPSADTTRADGYSKVLHFKGAINPTGENVLRIEVNDVRDGLLDSGVLIRGGSFHGNSVNEFYVDAATNPLFEAQGRDIEFGLHLPQNGAAKGPLTVVFDPTDGLDLGAGAGRAVTRTLLANGTLEGHVTATAIADGKNDGSRLELVTFTVTGIDAPVGGVAPLVLQIDDALIALTRSVGDAPIRYSRAAPNAWADAWTEAGLQITHTADQTVREPVYSAVNFGTANPGLLSGSDMLAGDLGVSGKAKGDPGAAQEIAGKEALRFHFDSGTVSALTIDFARFGRGDSAKVELRDDDGAVLRTVIADTANLSLIRLDGVAEVIVSAATGSFTIDRVSFTEMLDPSLARLFASSDHEPMPAFMMMPDVGMNLGQQHYQIA